MILIVKTFSNPSWHKRYFQKYIYFSQIILFNKMVMEVQTESESFTVHPDEYKKVIDWMGGKYISFVGAIINDTVYIPKEIIIGLEEYPDGITGIVTETSLGRSTTKVKMPFEDVLKMMEITND